jgi:hypothetical protein
LNGAFFFVLNDAAIEGEVHKASSVFSPFTDSAVEVIALVVIHTVPLSLKGYILAGFSAKMHIPCQKVSLCGLARAAGEYGAGGKEIPRRCCNFLSLL